MCLAPNGLCSLATECHGVFFRYMGKYMYFVIILSEMKARPESSTVPVFKTTFGREGTDLKRLPG